MSHVTHEGAMSYLNEHCHFDANNHMSHVTHDFFQNQIEPGKRKQSQMGASCSGCAGAAGKRVANSVKTALHLSQRALSHIRALEIEPGKRKHTVTLCSLPRYGVATISRLLKIIGLFCKRAL